ncbi:hypothetical protein BCON_0002g01100 [Botryotinia convoluta]|uniref:Uncharacterized protein n=1 Tax=Botryotinia convoluta TaxID=54673 RepID=A0A4Z1IVZ4_9HELO|nr:hypothetical protein BCON_0002g01100 [Botryotinia convoluta]
MSSPDLGPLAMSQTKDDLVKHLNISAETYTLMAKETDTVYRWLISEKCHLKKNCKGKPPYDWSDIVERSKDEAMKLIVQNGTDQTAYYWNLAKPTLDCPNWIARWFLYHKFRYRDGRNRNIRADSRDTAPYNSTTPSHHHHHHHHHSHRSYPSHHRHVQVDEQYSHSSYYSNASMNTGDSQGYDYSSTEPSSSTSGYATYSSSQTYTPSSSYVSYTSSPITRENGQTKPYDPVRDL